MVSLIKRRQDIEKAKGLAILLVVFGHIVARSDPDDVGWYEPLRHGIYTFHMPFFLYLSGLTCVYSGAAFTHSNRWCHFVTARARRFLLPFFALGAFIVLGKSFARSFMFVDNYPINLVTAFQNLVWHTADSAAGSVWYLFVVFILTATTPLLVWVDHGRLRFVIAAAAGIYCLPLPQFVYLDQISKFSIFFAIGAWAASQAENWYYFVDRHWRKFLIILLGVAPVMGYFYVDMPIKIFLLPIGIVSIPALHGLVRHPRLPFAPVFLWLGDNCFMIYLFNTICIGVLKGILLQITNWNGSHFLPFAIALMISGSLGPIFLRKVVFRQVRLFSCFTA